jgi:alpha-tubulin suppressor-like RCC1 family protein
MKYKVKEVAEMVGVSIATLHHYDKINLLSPESVNEVGYRFYTDCELERLQQILFFREMEFSLKEIKDILDRPDFDRKQALEVHIDILLQKKKRLEDIIDTVYKTIQSINGGMKMNPKDMFKGFDITDIEESKKKYTAGGFEHSLAVKADGTVWGWGNFGQEESSVGLDQTPLLSDVKTVAASSGHYHSFAIKNDGSVWGWGSNSHGQLGINAKEDYVKVPIKIHDLDQVVSVSAGVFHTLALKDDGSVWTWGPNWYGQLGNGSYNERKSPSIVENLTSVKEVAAGFFHSLALKDDGTVWRWGGYGDSTNEFPIKDQSPSPVRVKIIDQIVAIAAGGSHGVALKDDGTVWTWGYNNEGQLGDGKFLNECSCEPRIVSGLTDVKAITAGGAFTMALRKDGTVWTWGDNTFGQLGDGTYESKCEGIEIPSINDVIHIAAGTKHAMAMKKDGSVWLWGSNDHGQLGDKTESTRNRPYKYFQTN